VVDDEAEHDPRRRRRAEPQALGRAQSRPDSTACVVRADRFIGLGSAGLKPRPRPVAAWPAAVGRRRSDGCRVPRFRHQPVLGRCVGARSRDAHAAWELALACDLVGDRSGYGEAGGAPTVADSRDGDDVAALDRTWKLSGRPAGGHCAAVAAAVGDIGGRQRQHSPFNPPRQISQKQPCAQSRPAQLGKELERLDQAGRDCRNHRIRGSPGLTATSPLRCGGITSLPRRDESSSSGRAQPPVAIIVGDLDGDPLRSPACVTPQSRQPIAGSARPALAMPRASGPSRWLPSSARNPEPTVGPRLGQPRAAYRGSPSHSISRRAGWPCGRSAPPAGASRGPTLYEHRFVATQTLVLARSGDRVRFQ
jgi:hypothetical protein